MAFNFIRGTDAAETINGTDQPDLVLAGAGDDVIYGGDSGDDLSGQLGNDIIYGGGGGDSIGGNEGTDTIYGEEGDDRLFGVASGDRIYGGNGDDLIVGGEGDDYLEGNNGNDRLYGSGVDSDYSSSDNNMLIGGLGNDFYSRGAGDYTGVVGYGFNVAVINSNVADAVIDFARGIEHMDHFSLSPSAVFITSPDGDDILDVIAVTKFNDGEFSSYASDLRVTFNLYDTFMGRKPVTSEYVFWGDRPAPPSGTDIRDAILSTSAGQDAFAASVNDTYRTLVGRNASLAETQLLLAELRLSNAQTLDGMRESVIEANAAAVGDLIDNTYQMLAGRGATGAEIAIWSDLFARAYHLGSFGWDGDIGSFATPDTLVNALMSDPGTRAAGKVLQLTATSGADVFTLPVGFTDVRITGFDVTQDRISFEGTGFSADALDPSLVRQTTNVTLSRYDNTTYLTNGNVLIELDAGHRIIVEGSYGELDREQYLSRSTDTIDTYYKRYLDRTARGTEVSTWTELFADGATYDTLVDTLLTVSGTATRLPTSAGADALVLASDFRDVVIDGFDPLFDMLSTRGTAFAGSDPLTHAREIVGLDGRPDVLITFDASHSILFDNLTLGQLSSSNFLS